ncbi:hypothetical protein DCC85_22260 [Paenibacillus sp. CAA11]|uniref:DUF6544 family protein n=1 Tax=Paenibacillus sp. CAA11 TaxID=1532905 RepID=UPI000D33831A|nr:DUF6544 family protein [Paenibacillus sp. CAA11]AWB46623.1 hypothetical protein DCC85_22260 [Paenibacillus sp. CAA11]
MLIGLLLLALIVVAVVVYFVIPYSPLKAKFNRDIKERIERSSQVTGVLTYEDVEDLPMPVKRYLKTCGYIGRLKSSYMKISFKDVDFKLSQEKPMIKIDYSQVNFVQKPDRVAFINTRMYGIPFQGYDSLLEGVGGMKGVLAKGIPLFNETGADMDQACLVTFLSESLLIPDAALQSYITWKEVNKTSAKAIITYGGIEASGLFTFSETGELLSFSTDDRIYTSTNGDRQQVKWTALFSDYQTKDGRKQPSRLQAIWHVPEGDMIYFDGSDFQIDRL